MAGTSWTASQLEGLSDHHSYEPDLWRRASDIPVQTFRQILIWPLFVELDRNVNNGTHEADDPGASGKPNSIAGLMRAITAELSKNEPGRGAGGVSSKARQPAFISPWKRESDPLNHINPPPPPTLTPEDLKQNERNISEEEILRRKTAAQQTRHENDKYAEFVYFHEVVQDFLYQKRSCDLHDNPDEVGISRLHLFKRQDVKQLIVKLGDDKDEGLEIHLDVDRCNLYLASTGIMLLALEVSWTAGDNSTPPAMQLSDAQILTDQLRRCYTPYVALPYARQDTAYCGMSYRSGQCPEKVELVYASSKQPLTNDRRERPNVIKERDRTLNVSEGQSRSPQLFPHWEELITPFRVGRLDGDTTGAFTTFGKGIRFSCRHIEDERIPIMTFISLTRPNCCDQSALANVSRGDWVRLCFTDAAGSDPLPYNPLFLEAFEKTHCYDRFFISKATPYFASRMLFSGYSFTTVGAGGFYDGLLQTHFRRHYFQMSLLAYLEHATLLGFSMRLTKEVAQYEQDRNDQNPNPMFEKKFHDAICDLKREFLLYTHQFRFTGVSNQMQPREMYDQWRSVMGLDKLYEDVKQELDTATDFLVTMDQQQQTDSAANLNVLASLGLAASLVFSFLGMNILFQKNPMNKFWKADTIVGSADFSSAIWMDLLLGAFGFLFIGGITYMVLIRLIGSSGKTVQERFTLKVLRFGLVLGLFASLFLWLWLDFPVTPT